MSCLLTIISTLLSFEQPKICPIVVPKSHCQRSMAKQKWAKEKYTRLVLLQLLTFSIFWLLDLKYWLGRYNSYWKQNFQQIAFTSQTLPVVWCFQSDQDKTMEGSTEKGITSEVKTFPVSHLVLKSEWPPDKSVTKPRVTWQCIYLTRCHLEGKLVCTVPHPCPDSMPTEC